MNKDNRAGLIQLGLVICFIVGSFALSKLLKTDYHPPGDNGAADRIFMVETVTVAPQPYRISFDTTGIVRARNQINVVPEVSGRVIRVHDTFFEGGSFNQGEILFEIEPRDYQLDVKRLEAEVARARTALQLATAESRAAEAEWEQVNLDTEVPDLVARRPQLAEAHANLQAAEALLEDAMLNLERTRFSFPFSGRVLNSNVAVGQYLMAGQSYGMVFDTKTLEVSASLVDRQLNWLLDAPHRDIQINTTYLGKRRHYKGELKRSASSLDVGTRFATVYFAFIDDVKDLLPGVFAEINIKGAEMSDVTLLPSSALQSQGIVWQVTHDRTLRSWVPEILYVDNDFTAVTGLSGEAEIVISRLSGAADGMQIATVGNENGNSPVIQ